MAGIPQSGTAVNDCHRRSFRGACGGNHSADNRWALSSSNGDFEVFSKLAFRQECCALVVGDGTEGDEFVCVWHN
jgi:hypothetical protein